jgi:hypothetical protein
MRRSRIAVLAIIAVGWIISSYKTGNQPFVEQTLLTHEELQSIKVGVDLPPCVGPCKDNKYDKGCVVAQANCPKDVGPENCRLATWHQACPGELNVSIIPAAGQPDTWAEPTEGYVCNKVLMGPCGPVNSADGKTIICEPGDPKIDEFFECGGSNKSLDCEN